MINPGTMMRFILAGLFFFCAFTVAARNKEFQNKTYSVYVNYPTYSVRAYVLFQNGKIRPQDGRTYFWYASNAIQQTESGFDGKLLHGEYKAFYLNNALKEWGHFHNGIKIGVWKNWHANGKLADECPYRHGRRHGTFRSYDEQGNLVLEAHYRHGLLNGTTRIYRNGEPTGMHKYKRGKEVEMRQKKKSAKDTATNPSPLPTVDSSKTTPPVTDSTQTKPRRSLFTKKQKTETEKPAESQPASTQPQPESPKRKSWFRKGQTPAETNAPQSTGNAPQN